MQREILRPGISSHLFLTQRLTPGLLDGFAAAGVRVIEVFAARHHFDYADRGAVREVANWFRSHDVAATMHMPLFGEEDAASWTRHTAASVNLIAAAKVQRIAAQDEVKRALEAAEQVPFKSCVLHLGLKDDKWDTRALDDSMTAIEHLKAFASPLGVKLLLENLPNEVATPEHLMEIVRVGHFDNVGFCLDTGHANLVAALPETSQGPAQSGVAQAFRAFGQRVTELHVHDNAGTRDEHLWPGDGGIDWREVVSLCGELTAIPDGVLEIAYDLTGADAARTELNGKVEKARRLFEASMQA